MIKSVLKLLALLVLFAGEVDSSPALMYNEII